MNPDVQSSCFYSAQGQLTCPPPGPRLAVAAVEGFSAAPRAEPQVSCPSDPSLRPRCAVDCPLVVQDNKCANGANQGTCQLCKMGCCQEHGRPDWMGSASMPR